MKKSVFCLVVGLAMASAATGAALGQATYTADKSSDINIFGGVSRVNPDYDQPQVGYIFGADYTRFFKRLYVAPSLEFRATISPTGRSVGEHVYAGGLKVEHRYHGRFNAYADILVGDGGIHYASPIFAPGGIMESSDTAFVIMYGGGVDVDVYRGYAVKVDFQGSRWSGLDIGTLSPSILSFGVVYHLPPLWGRRH